MDQQNKVGWVVFIAISLSLLHQTICVKKRTSKSDSLNPSASRLARKSDAGSITADDACLSLFYDKNIGNDGIGFPTINTISPETVSRLKSVHPEYKKLPLELYKPCVEKMIICCVDIVCQRESDKKFLLFYRRDAPASNIWWW